MGTIKDRTSKATAVAELGDIITGADRSIITVERLIDCSMLFNYS